MPLFILFSVAFAGASFSSDTCLTVLFYTARLITPYYPFGPCHRTTTEEVPNDYRTFFKQECRQVIQW
jgi:hypothetical protein